MVLNYPPARLRMAVVHEDEKIDAFSLVVGVPARLSRVLPEDTYDTHCKWAQKYIALAEAHRRRL